MSPDIHIRPLAIKDFDNGFPGVLKVLAPVNLTKKQAVELFVSTHMSGASGPKFFVALDGQRVVGCTTLLLEQKFIHGGGLVAHIEDVAVDTNYQGQGIGCSLVGRCIDEARRIGCYKVILDCADNVRGFYERLGFFPHQNHMRYDINGVQERPPDRSIG